MTSSVTQSKHSYPPFTPSLEPERQVGETTKKIHYSSSASSSPIEILNKIGNISEPTQHSPSPTNPPRQLKISIPTGSPNTSTSISKTKKAFDFNTSFDDTFCQFEIEL